MPELPEVETVRRSLEQLVKGKTITDVTVFYHPMIEIDSETFIRTLKGKTIHAVERAGKHLLFDLGDLYLLSHLRMEGKYFLKRPGETKDKHEHVIFYLEDQETLRYHDVRKFGTMALREKGLAYQTPPLSLLGKEPLEADFDGTYLWSRMKHTRRAVKTALLDQRLISGLGNIYVDETLFCAGIHPEKKTTRLRKKDCHMLASCSTQVLKKAVDLGGSSIRSYTDSLGITGRFQNELNVHLQKNRPCQNCGTSIQKIKVNGRGTYFCPTCQRR